MWKYITVTGSLYNNLVSYGYECVKPQGAFYLFVKALEQDDKKFAQEAKSIIY